MTIYSQTSPVATGRFGGLSPPNRAPRPLKLKYETLEINGVLSNFQCQAPLYKSKSPLLKTFWRRFRIRLPLFPHPKHWFLVGMLQNLFRAASRSN